MEIEKLTGKGVGVAVLDTGIFPHIDFDDRIVSFTDLVSHKTKPYDDNGHGTHVAGILAGSGKGCRGKYVGAAPGCHLAVLKVLDQYGNGRKEVLLRSFRWIGENKDKYKIRIVNISVGTTCSHPGEHKLLEDAVEVLWDAGLVVVAAAGNHGPGPGTVTAPGSSRKIITVGSGDMLQKGHSSSGRGPTGECVCKPDLVAPGYEIMSCAPPGNSPMPNYVRKSGTSMSTPYVSGAIARMLEKDSQLTNIEIKMLLRDCAKDMGYPRNVQGWGSFSMERFLSL